LSAFIGTGQRKRRIDALRLQSSVLNDGDLAEALERVGEPMAFAEGETLIEQGDDDDDVFLILGGFVDLEISGHPYLQRQARELVGEMAVLEPGTRRSATVRAGSGGVTVLKVSCDDFCEIGKDYPDLWRNIARDLSGRLRQRNAYFIPPNSVPKIFIASSSLGKPTLELLNAELKNLGHDTRPWTHPDIFKPTEAPMDSLERQARFVDFAVIIATADDRLTKNFLTRSRSTALSARDNVMLEFGLFAGALERQRVFILSEDHKKLSLPTDLAGLTTLRFQTASEVIDRAATIDMRIRDIGALPRLRRSLAS